jgi:uncharacterized protein
MQFQDLHDKHDGFYEPWFEVRLADKVNQLAESKTKFTGSDGIVSDVSVETTISGADRFSFTLNNLFDRSGNGAFAGLNPEFFSVDKRVQISIGYRDLTPIFVGTIQSANPTFPAGGSPTVNVSGYGLLQDMMTGTHTKSWRKSEKGADPKKVKDSEVADEIVSKDHYGFTNRQITDTKLKLRQIVQEKQSDYQFLQERAKRYNFEVFARERTFFFREPAETQEPKVTLKYGESLNSVSFGRNETSQVGQVKTVSSNPKGGKEGITGTAGRGGSNAETKTLPVRAESEAEAKQIAQAELGRIKEARVTGNGETIGLPEIQAGDTIQLDGLGQFSKRYYITSTSHRIGGSGYTTTFQIRLPKEEKI